MDSRIPLPVFECIPSGSFSVVMRWAKSTIKVLSGRTLSESISISSQKDSWRKLCISVCQNFSLYRASVHWYCSHRSDCFALLNCRQGFSRISARCWFHQLCVLPFFYQAGPILIRGSDCLVFPSTAISVSYVILTIITEPFRFSQLNWQTSYGNWSR